MTDALYRDKSILVHAYLDGELDSANTLAFEEQMSSDPELAAECERIKAYQDLVRKHFPRKEAPAGLRARIDAQVGAPRPAVQHSWRALAASIAVTAVLASGATSFILSPEPTDKARDAIVAAHIRSLMAPNPIDIASSDRHTVKPWFNGKIPDAPRVVDLAQASFPLVGGRLDVVAHTAVPTLVYRHAKHLISLTAEPAPGRSDSGAASQSTGGYNILNWTNDGITYWAVSDIQSTDLSTFARLFRVTPADR